MVVDQGEVVRKVTDMGKVSAIWRSLRQDMVGEWWARSTTCLRGWSLGVTVKVGVDVARDASGVKHFVPGRCHKVYDLFKVQLELFTPLNCTWLSRCEVRHLTGCSLEKGGGRGVADLCRCWEMWRSRCWEGMRPEG